MEIGRFDFLATRQRLVKIDEGQQKIKIVRTNRQSKLRASCQSIFSLSRHPTLAPKHQNYELPANQFSPSPGTTLVGEW